MLIVIQQNDKFNDIENHEKSHALIVKNLPESENTPTPILLVRGTATKCIVLLNRLRTKRIHCLGLDICVCEVDQREPKGWDIF